MSTRLPTLVYFWACILLVAVFLLSSATVATAATKFWKNNAGSGNWSNGNNWSNVSAAGIDNGGAPGINDTVRVSPTDGVARTITHDAPSLLTHLEVDLTGAGAAATTLSMSTFNLSSSSEYIGFNGRGVFNHSGGTNNVTGSGGADFLDLGVFPGAVGTYNLSGTGAISSNNSEFIGDFGTGFFNQTGGTNSIFGAGHHLTLGFGAGSAGTYTISGGSLTVNSGDIIVGNNGVGTLTIQNQASVSLAHNLSINNLSTVNMNGGTLRLTSVTGGGALNYTAGTIKLADGHAIGFDTTISTLFGAVPVIASNKALTIEGDTEVRTNLTVNGGTLTGQSGLFRVGFNNNGSIAVTGGGTVVSNVTSYIAVSTGIVASVSVSDPGSSWTVNGDLWVGTGGTGSMNVTGGGTVTTTGDGLIAIGTGVQTPSGNVLVSGPGSTWTVGDELAIGDPSSAGVGVLTIADQGLVYVTNGLFIDFNDALNLNGGTLRFDTISPGDESRLFFNSGTLQLSGSRTIGTDTYVSTYYGVLPVVPAGKGLTIEGTATLSKPLTIAGGTFKANALVVGAGGALDFDRGVLELTGGAITGLSSMIVPTNGEFRASGVQPVRVTGAAGSTITATGNLTLGSATAVNGFGTQGTLTIGANTVTLLDANDVVFDSLSLATLGSGASPGTLTAANGLTLDFGGNITGFGTVTTPNLLAKPLINNGHITGNSAAQRITLPGYVKGVGTFDNVNLTGTFSPGLSPTILTVGNVGFSSTSTLIMELGGAAPGSGYDQILSSGALGFDGTLQLALINGFSPAVGQSFNLFDWASVSGTFDTLTLPTLGAGLSWNTSALYTAGLLSVSTGLAGDFDGDGDVDGRDFLLWQRGGSPSPLSAGDLTAWQGNYGSGPLTAASVAVPEPVALALLLIVMGAIAFRRDSLPQKMIV